MARHAPLLHATEAKAAADAARPRAAPSSRVRQIAEAEAAAARRRAAGGSVQLRAAPEAEGLLNRAAKGVVSLFQPPKAPNRTGLPDRLKAGVESLSGLAMDDVRVHRNSPEPAKLGALAYTQGTEIHLGPGQEEHLPHEAWHAVQQKQGRVGVTAQFKGIAVNRDQGLEAEANSRGAQLATFPLGASPGPSSRPPAETPIQMMTCEDVVQLRAEAKSAVRQTQAPLQGGTPWGWSEFVGQYYAGNGAAVDLGNVGLGMTFRSHRSVQNAVNSFIALALAKPEPTFHLRDSTVTDVTDTIFSVGHSTFFRTATGIPTACGFHFSIRDWFRDPVSLGIELGGTPYPINFAWTESRLRAVK